MPIGRMCSFRETCPATPLARSVLITDIKHSHARCAANLDRHFIILYYH